MKPTHLATILALMSSPVLADSPRDACMIQCQANGTNRFECRDRCAGLSKIDRTPPAEEFQPSKRVDWQCMQHCQGAGYQYGFCINKCSF